MKKLIIVTVTILTLFSFGFTGVFGAIGGEELFQIHGDFDSNSVRMIKAVEEIVKNQGTKKLEGANRIALQFLLKRFQAKVAELAQAPNKEAAIEILAKMKGDLTELSNKFSEYNLNIGIYAERLANIVGAIENKLKEADEEDFELFKILFGKMNEKIKMWRVSAISADGSDMY